MAVLSAIIVQGLVLDCFPLSAEGVLLSTAGHAAVRCDGSGLVYQGTASCQERNPEQEE